jgi:hypothetical protein
MNTSEPHQHRAEHKKSDKNMQAVRTTSYEVQKQAELTCGARNQSISMFGRGRI